MVAYLTEHVVPLLIGRDADAHRGHLAVPLPQRLLAPRSGDDGRDRRRRHGAVGHQGQGRRACRCTSCSAGRPATGCSPTATRRARTCRAVRQRPRAPGAGLPGHPHPDRRAGAEVDLRDRVERDLRGATRACATTTSPRSAARCRTRRTGTPARTCATCPTVFEAVRNEFGPELPLLHDGHHRMTPIQAAQLGKSLEPYDLFWLEDCTPAENQEALRLVRQHTTTPLAIGEIFNTVWDYQQIIREQLIDYVRCAVTHTGGITAPQEGARLRRAVPDQVRACTGPTDISPVGMAAAMHLGLAIHNFGIQEYMKHGAEDRRGVPAVLHLRGRAPAPGRRSPASVSSSTSTRPASTRTSAPTCPTTGSPTAPCTTGEVTPPPGCFRMTSAESGRSNDDPKATARQPASRKERAFAAVMPPVATNRVIGNGAAHRADPGGCQLSGGEGLEPRRSVPERRWRRHSASRRRGCAARPARRRAQ